MPESSTHKKLKNQSSNKPKGEQQEMLGCGMTNAGGLRRRRLTEINGEGIDRPKLSVVPGGGSGGGRSNCRQLTRVDFFTWL